jgi:ubiquinone/menaquinone biosynthesis C-methylase UbiE
MSNEHDSRVQSQFGASAEQYRTSPSHARGRSLSRLLELVDPQPDWLVLDAATGAGHTAATLAPRVASVVAGDLTLEMLQQAMLVSRERKLPNILFVRESALALAYRDDVFDLITCRVAAHHFPEPGLFVAECARVLKPGGMLAVIDNIVPDDGPCAGWINDFERQRDPSHARCLSLEEWRGLYDRHGLRMAHEEVGDKWFDFEDWMRRMHVGDAAIEHLALVLLDAPAGVRDFWHPRRDNERLKLALQEAILVGRLEA